MSRSIMEQLIQRFQTQSCLESSLMSTKGLHLYWPRELENRLYFLATAVTMIQQLPYRHHSPWNFPRTLVFYVTHWRHLLFRLPSASIQDIIASFAITGNAFHVSSPIRNVIFIVTHSSENVWPELDLLSTQCDPGHLLGQPWSDKVFPGHCVHLNHHWIPCGVWHCRIISVS